VAGEEKGAETAAGGNSDERTYRYEIDVADGVPAEYRIKLSTSEPETWNIRAEWDGRGIAGLWLESDKGEVLHKRVSTTPLSMAFRIDTDPGQAGRELYVKFATMTNRGPVKGFVELSPAKPEAEVVEEEREADDPARSLAGPGRCLSRGFGDDSMGRALEAFAFAIEDGGTGSRSWATRWVQRLVDALAQIDHPRDRRDAVDAFWERVLSDPAPDEEVDKAFRGVLSGVESLVREEGLSRRPEAARSKQTVLLQILGCLDDPS